MILYHDSVYSAFYQTSGNYSQPFYVSLFSTDYYILLAGSEGNPLRGSAIVLIILAVLAFICSAYFAIQSIRKKQFLGKSSARWATDINVSAAVSVLIYLVIMITASVMCAIGANRGNYDAYSASSYVTASAGSTPILFIVFSILFMFITAGIVVLDIMLGKKYGSEAACESAGTNGIAADQSASQAVKDAYQTDGKAEYNAACKAAAKPAKRTATDDIRKAYGISKIAGDCLFALFSVLMFLFFLAKIISDKDGTGITQGNLYTMLSDDIYGVSGSMVFLLIMAIVCILYSVVLFIKDFKSKDRLFSGDKKPDACSLSCSLVCIFLYCIVLMASGIAAAQASANALSLVFEMVYGSGLVGALPAVIYTFDIIFLVITICAVVLQCLIFSQFTLVKQDAPASPAGSAPAPSENETDTAANETATEEIMNTDTPIPDNPDADTSEKPDADTPDNPEDITDTQDQSQE